MKKTPLYTFVLILGLYGCSSQKKLVENPPFSVNNPTSQEFTAGREEGGSGYILKIPLDGMSRTILFEQVYFRGRLLEPETEIENGIITLICKFQRTMPDKSRDLIMHADPMEEVGNQPPSLLKENEEDFPFELNSDEAVIEYKEEGKRKSRFFKISGIKEKMPLQYPSRPQN